MNRDGRIDYVYILAASHSGSTLLAMLLNAHPSVATVGEFAGGGPEDAAGYRCSCRALIQECGFWQKVAEAMLPHYPQFTLTDWGTRVEPRHSLWTRRILRFEHRGTLVERLRDVVLATSPSWRTRFSAVSDRCGKLARIILDLTGTHVLVDSSKLAHRLKYMLRVSAFNAKVIHLVRDGRAVALTYMDPDSCADATDPAMRRGGRGPGAPATAPRLPMRQAADEWCRCIRSAECALAYLDPSRWICVRYEDLCLQPTATTDRLLTFMGLDPSLRACSFRSVEHHMVGNGMRLDSTSAIQIDNRWRNVLTRKDLATFEREAGNRNRRYGYTT